MLGVVTPHAHLLDEGARRVVASVVAHRDPGCVAGSDLLFRIPGGGATAVGAYAHDEQRFISRIDELEIHRLDQVKTESAETLRRLGKLYARPAGKRA